MSSSSPSLRRRVRAALDCRHPDSAALVALLRPQQTWICAVLRRHGRDEPDLQDELLQSILIRLWKCDPARASSPEKAGAYVRRAVMFAVLDVTRRLDDEVSREDHDAVVEQVVHHLRAA